VFPFFLLGNRFVRTSIVCGDPTPGHARFTFLIGKGGPCLAGEGYFFPSVFFSDGNGEGVFFYLGGFPLFFFLELSGMGLPFYFGFSGFY